METKLQVLAEDSLVKRLVGPPEPEQKKPKLKIHQSLNLRKQVLVTEERYESIKEKNSG